MTWVHLWEAFGSPVACGGIPYRDDSVDNAQRGSCILEVGDACLDRECGQ